jgi:hypothetical protein
VREQVRDRWPGIPDYAQDKVFEKFYSLAEPGIEKSELIRECVKAFIQLQTARRLAALGGQAPDIELAPRRREEAV